METRRKKISFRKILGIILLSLAILGLSDFILVLIMLFYGKEFFNPKSMPAVFVCLFLIPIILLLLADKLLHCKKESGG